MVQEAWGGAVLNRAADGSKAAERLDQLATEERAEDSCAINTADRLDLGSGDRLPVGDHGQRLDGCWREARFAVETEEPADGPGEARRRRELDPIAVANQHPAPSPVCFHRGERRLDRGRRRSGAPRQVEDGRRLRRHEEERLQHRREVGVVFQHGGIWTVGLVRRGGRRPRVPDAAHQPNPVALGSTPTVRLETARSISPNGSGWLAAT